METTVISKTIDHWHKRPHGFSKQRFSDIHNEILFDRAVTAQLYCPNRVRLTAYTAPGLAFVDENGQACAIRDRKPYKYMPSKKEILEYTAEVAIKVDPGVPFDIVTQDALSCFENGRARIGGLAAEQTGQFSSVVVYRHRP